MSNVSTESNYSFTTKIGNDLFTVRGNDANEFQQNLSAAATGNLIEFARGVQEAAQAVGNLQTVQQSVGGEVVAEHPAAPQAAPALAAVPDPVPTQAVPAPVPAAPAAPAAVQQPGIPIPACSHGGRQFRTGQGKYGEWQAWFCPTPKGTPDQCDAIFLKRDELLNPQQVAALTS